MRMVWVIAGAWYSIGCGNASKTRGKSKAGTRLRRPVVCVPWRPEEQPRTRETRMSGRLETWRLQAYNTAKQSENKMHDDTVAKRFGFSGGLVPGVDVMA